jgi:hypothetical protein
MDIASEEGWISDASRVEQAIATLTSPAFVELLGKVNDMPVATAYKAFVESLTALRGQKA